MARYRNSFHPMSGPAFFESAARPVKHAGHLIYKRHKDCWDIVRGGVCIHIYAGLSSAKKAAERAALAAAE